MVFVESMPISIGAATETIRFSVLNWAAWSPGLEARADWTTWAGVADTAPQISPPSRLSMMLRRRLSPFGQRLFEVARDCGDGLPTARYVLSTRHGELNRAITSLEAIEEGELPSPTDFSMSIHHALLGLLSIHTGNRLGHTALSAGWDSFVSGLLEATTCIAERATEPVILIHADEPLPQDYGDFAEADDASLPLVIALALGAPGAARAADLSLTVATISPGSSPSQSMARDFLRFVLSGAPRARSAGRRLEWVCSRANHQA